MIKSFTAEIGETLFITKLRLALKKLSGLYSSIRNAKILSEDIIYKLNFIKNYLPEMYNRHIISGYKNCIFCCNLEKIGFHNYCFKCSAGTYIHGSPLLPGYLYFEAVHSSGPEATGTPWYFKKTCGCFTRLPQNSYLKHFGSIFGSTGIFNFEVLEGLEQGLSAGERPCFVCALSDYKIYKSCSSCKDFDKYSPCNKITGLLSDLYNS